MLHHCRVCVVGELVPVHAQVEWGPWCQARAPGCQCPLDWVVSSRETGEQLGKEGTGAQGGLGQQLKASGGLSEVQDSLRAVPVPTLCMHMLV